MKKLIKKIFFVGDGDNGIYDYFDTAAEAQAAYEQNAKIWTERHWEPGTSIKFNDLYSESLDFHFFGSCDEGGDNEIILS